MTKRRRTVDERRDLLGFAKRALHGLDESRVFLGCLSDKAPLSDARIEFALQIGHSLLVGKPIVLTVPRGVDVPPKLLAAADEVIYYSPGNLEEMQAGLSRYFHRVGAKIT